MILEITSTINCSSYPVVLPIYTNVRMTFSHLNFGCVGHMLSFVAKMDKSIKAHAYLNWRKLGSLLKDDLEHPWSWNSVGHASHPHKENRVHNSDNDDWMKFQTRNRIDPIALKKPGFWGSTWIIKIRPQINDSHFRVPAFKGILPNRWWVECRGLPGYAL